MKKWLAIGLFTAMISLYLFIWWLHGGLG